MISNNHGPARYVREWNRALGEPVGLSRTGALVTEEAAELVEACASGDLAWIAKEACDVAWTAIDVLVAYGIDFNAAFTEVARSNMSKLGSDYAPPDPFRLVGPTLISQEGRNA